MREHTLFLKVTSTPKVLSKVRNRIRKFAESLKMPPVQVDNVELAVDEAVSNVILHAYQQRTNGLIHVYAYRENKKLLVKIRDFGRGFNPKPVNVSTIRKVIKNYTRGGMGRYIMKMCMDSVTYISLPRQYNETVMTKKLVR
ncbi:ATP-binding protein [candidate division FCPU426 bacterium]|nr:ATP-binding protein [candidate division FCPU426 bacterium]